MRISRVAKFLIVLFAAAFVFQGVAVAKTPYHDYNFDETGKDDTAAAPGYLPYMVLNAETLGMKDENGAVDQFEQPYDMYTTDQYLYLLDSGKSRIIVVSFDHKFVRQIKFTGADGKALNFGKAKGLFVEEDYVWPDGTKGRILIAEAETAAGGGASTAAADTSSETQESSNTESTDSSTSAGGDTSTGDSSAGNGQTGMVYLTDMNGKVQNTIGAPVSPVIPSGFSYKPIKVIVDQAGMIYVLTEGSTNGSLQYTPDLQFEGFYGFQRVQMTPELFIELMWRNIMSADQINATQTITPTVFESFDMGKDGFVYTLANPQDEDKIGTDQVMKLNALNKNVFLQKGMTYGDPTSYFDPQLGTFKSNFRDIKVDQDGIYYVLDRTRGRIFVYGPTGWTLTVFGGSNSSDNGKQIGMSHIPCAIEVHNEYVYVMDESNKNVTVYKQTDYMANLRQGIILDGGGYYKDAGPYWMNVLKYDYFNMPANSGIAKYYREIGEYEKSLQSATLCYDWDTYSLSFKDVRDQATAQFFPVIMAVIVLLAVGPIVISNIRRRHRKDEYTIHRKKWQFPLFCAFHPFKAYTELKFEKQGSISIATGVVFLLLMTMIFSQTLVSFLYNPGVANILYFNLSATIASTLGGFILWVACNWAITTLFDGEGKFTEIFVFSAYAFIPWILVQIPIIILSNILTGDEMIFLEILSWIGLVWTAVSLTMAVREVHQYTLGGTILAILFTAIAMVLVVCVIALVYSMFLQLTMFVSNIFNEMSLRM